MKKIFLLFLTATIILNIYGQVTDSIKTTTGTLYYHLYGKGKPILLLSGGPGASAFMLEPIAVALQKEFQPVLFEQRGTGKSIPNPFDSTTINLQQAADDINRIKDKLSVKKLIIIGHSYGAMLALYYAVKHPLNVEKLVLVGPADLEPGISFGNENRTARATVEEREATRKANDSVRLNIATAGTVERNRKRYLRTMIYDAYKTDSLFPILAKGGALNVKMNQLMQKDISRNYHLRDEISKIKVSTIVICGRQDPVCIFPCFEIAQLNKKMLILWISKSGHYPFVEQPEEFYKVALPFLKQ